MALARTLEHNSCITGSEDTLTFSWWSLFSRILSWDRCVESN